MRARLLECHGHRARVNRHCLRVLARRAHLAATLIGAVAATALEATVHDGRRGGEEQHAGDEAELQHGATDEARVLVHCAADERAAAVPKGGREGLQPQRALLPAWVAFEEEVHEVLLHLRGIHRVAHRRPDEHCCERLGRGEHVRRPTRCESEHRDDRPVAMTCVQPNERHAQQVAHADDGAKAPHRPVHLQEMQRHRSEGP
mmetsp:Transcript_7130/g.22275  ORF Transcript_7130/g.22275 Transcript_7130/m.22275 type:complete len:203 (+) Transcript_7130:479-1087(+)